MLCFGSHLLAAFFMSVHLENCLGVDELFFVKNKIAYSMSSFLVIVRQYLLLDIQVYVHPNPTYCYT